MIELLLQAERALSVGLLDRAETLYRQVARADPRNSMAVVGLARVTLDRGDEHGALDLARRALAIDPENDAAQRMVARLEEVIDYRVRVDDAAQPEVAAALPEPAGMPQEPAVTDVAAEPAARDESETTAKVAPDPQVEAAFEPETEAEPARAIVPGPAEPAAQAATSAEPVPVVEPTPAIAPAVEPAPMVAPESRPEPPPKPERRRSFLDWLFRRR